VLATLATKRVFALTTKVRPLPSVTYQSGDAFLSPESRGLRGVLALFDRGIVAPADAADNRSLNLSNTVAGPCSKLAAM